MADTFTALLRLVLQETGGNENVWGSINNASAIQLLETAIAGRITVDVTAADVVLTTVNGATDQARNAMLAITGNPGVARNVTVPSTSKIYMVSNETSPAFDVTIKTSAGSGVVVEGGQIVFIYVDPSADDTFFIVSTIPATETQQGVAELATQAEVDAGSDDTRIVTAFKLANATSLLQATEIQKGALEIGTQAEVDAGIDQIRALTPDKLEAWSGGITASFTGTLTGFASNPSGTIHYKVSGGQVMVWNQTGLISSTSDATAFTMTGLPAAIRPTTAVNLFCTFLRDNTVSFQHASCTVETDGTLTFARGDPFSATGWTAAGTKGMDQGWMISYILN